MTGERMKDLGVILADRPGSLADLGQALGAAGVSLEGGGVFTHDGIADAHFLVDDGPRGRRALEEAGIRPVRVSEVVKLKLDQEVPGQLGLFTRSVADAGINILVLYSDHEHNLVLVVDPAQHAECARIARDWDTARARRRQDPDQSG